MQHRIIAPFAGAVILCTLAACGGIGDRAAKPIPSFPSSVRAATIYGTFCYSARFRSETIPWYCHQSQWWHDGELQALRGGEFVIPMSEADLRGLYANAWDEDGLLRNEVSQMMFDVWAHARFSEDARGPRGPIESFLVRAHHNNLAKGGKFSNVQEGVQYRARFCADADVCPQSAATWEVDTVRVTFQPVAQ